MSVNPWIQAEKSLAENRGYAENLSHLKEYEIFAIRKSDCCNWSAVECRSIRLANAQVVAENRVEGTRIY